jgi:hypothetical protein
LWQAAGFEFGVQVGGVATGGDEGVGVALLEAEPVVAEAVSGGGGDGVAVGVGALRIGRSEER